MNNQPPPHFTDTRNALHRLAEHVLASDLQRRTTKLGLRVTPGGFGQPEIHGSDGRHRLRIDGTQLVVLSGDTEQWFELSTASQAAADANTVVSAPVGEYTPETTVEPEDNLDIDGTAAQYLGDWFALGNAALEIIRREHAALEPTIVQLWPEHFDAAFSVHETNVGVSPGDGAHDEPYLYVGPWSLMANEYWNEPFGASARASTINHVDDAVRFFREGLGHAFTGV